MHESFNDTIHLPPLPVPLLEADGRFANFEIYAYGWAPPVSIPYSNAVQGQVALRLTILNATFRVWDGKHRFAVGIGKTVYNQTTHYAAADVYAPSGDEQQYSRIVGAHYEVDARMPYRAGAIETYVSYAPVLLGTQVSAYGDGSPTRFDPERGEQIEANVRYLRAIGRHSFAELGVRYVNFTAAYDVRENRSPTATRRCYRVSGTSGSCECSDGDRPVRGADGRRHRGCGFRVLAKPLLGAIGGEYRPRCGVLGVLLAIPEAPVNRPPCHPEPVEGSFQSWRSLDKLGMTR